MYTWIESRFAAFFSLPLSSHSIFNIVKDDNVEMNLKGRISEHDNPSFEKQEVRSYCSTEDMAVIRMVLSIGTCFRFTFSTADIKGSFMESGPITREVGVGPLRKVFLNEDKYRIFKSPYGLLNAGRQWSIII